MRSRCVIAEFDSVQAARTGLAVLEKAGFDKEQVSVVTRHDHPALDDIADLEEDAAKPAGIDAGAGVGALLGGAVAAPVAVGTMVGPFILVGPLVAMGLGAAAGSALGGAQEWGVSPEAGEAYEEKVKNGALLVMVAGTESQVREAKRSLQTTGPVDLTTFARAEHSGRD